MEFKFSGSIMEAFVFDAINLYEFICNLYKLIKPDENSSIINSSLVDYID